ncbi:MAG: hypothetical protein LWX07_11400 [Bacteroidetes bacterium]|nr:hypothetical protein [Bacteroidota bacterium]
MDTSNKQKGLYIVIIVLLVINIATLGFMWYISLRGPRHDKGPMPLAPPPEVLFKEELKFNADQMKKMEAFRDEDFTATKKIHDEIRDLKKNISDIVKTGNDDEANKLAAQIGDKQKELEMLRYQHFKQIRGICDDVQKQKFDEMMKKIPGPEDMQPGPGMMQQGPPPDMSRQGPTPEQIKQAPPRDGNKQVQPDTNKKQQPK